MEKGWCLTFSGRTTALLRRGAEQVTVPVDGTPSRGWLVPTVVTTIVVFVCDVWAPPGYAVPIFFTLPILLTRLTPELPSTIVTASSTVLLTWLGAALSQAVVTQHDSPNRAMTTTLLLGIAWLVITQKQSARQIQMAQQARHESEERLRIFIEHAPVALAMFDRDMQYLAVSRRWMDHYDLWDKQIIGRSHYEIFPDLPARLKVAHRQGLAGEIVREEEDRFERVDGSEQWLCWEVRPWQMHSDRVGGIVIFTEDITDRKKGSLALLQNQKELRIQQAQLQDLTEKLLTAQEQERKRIARDLHDDFTQRLAALTIDLQSRSLLQASESDALNSWHLKQLGDKAEQLTTDLQRLAHQLHPSLLEHAGLEAAAREYVEEFSARTGLATEIVVRDLRTPIPLEQATCLYRVLQESLQNVRKHAEATNVLVRLIRAGRTVGISVVDDGCGFEQFQNVGKLDGLGLTSMAERVKALHGTFHVRTKPGDGTEVEAWVSLPDMIDDD